MAKVLRNGRGNSIVSDGIEYVAAVAREKYDIFRLRNKIVIAEDDAAIGETKGATLASKSEYFPKTTEAMLPCDEVYYDETAEKATLLDASGVNLWIGTVKKAADASATHVQVRFMNQDDVPY